jgi:hypothetical protein
MARYATAASTVSAVIGLTLTLHLSPVSADETKSSYQPATDAVKADSADVIHAFGLSVPARSAKSDSANVIHAFGLSVPGRAADPNSGEVIHAFGLDIREDSNRESAQTQRDKSAL